MNIFRSATTEKMDHIYHMCSVINTKTYFVLDLYITSTTLFIKLA